MAASRQQLDNRIEVVTPENIAFEYRLAGPFRRLPAYLIDLFIRFTVVALAAIGLMLFFGVVGLGNVGFGFVLVTAFVLEWFYGGLFETFFNGQTPGKRLMRIRVLSINGEPIDGMQAVLRNFLRAADVQPLMTYVVGLVATAMNRRFQRLGDLAAGTMVVVEEGRYEVGVVLVREPEALRLASEIPASFEVSRSLGKALASYVQRRRNFAIARRMEIARHLGEPLRERFGMPAGVNYDLLLCGLYHRAFVADREEEPAGNDPFMPAAQLSGASYQAAVVGSSVPNISSRV